MYNMVILDEVNYMYNEQVNNINIMSLHNVIM